MKRRKENCCCYYCYGYYDSPVWCGDQGLDEISVKLRTVDNYTRLLQSDLRTLNESLTESRQHALDLLQCSQQPSPAQTECNTIKDEVTRARLALDYLQVT